ncbi:MAG: sulfite exporter TauE/SafE family protein [Methylophilaceae bacterium]|nr:sulfite exporter TauE/SafE family protein [Methylophilaceae bacterium]
MEFLISDYLTAFFIFLGAVLYSSVGHGGASFYIAIMAFMGTPITSIKPIGLILNIIVSSVSSYRYIRHKLFNIKVFLPVALGSIPAAFIGGYISLPGSVYRLLVGLILIIGGLQFLFNIFRSSGVVKNKVNPYLGFFAGLLIGFISGLTGTGGGIFLSPLIVFLGWTSVKGASGTAALFILFNSIAGLLGSITLVRSLPSEIYLYILAVVLGVLIGTQLGIKYLMEEGVKRSLGVVLIIAGIKFILT